MKKLLRKHWPLLGIGSLVLIALFYLVKGQAIFSAAPIIESLISKDGVQIENIHFTQDDPDDRMKWTLDAGKASVSKDRNVIFFEDFRIKLKAEHRPFIELTGQRGDYNKGTGSLNLQGDLQGQTEDGYRVKTDRVRYEHKEGLLESDQPISITGPFFTLEGKGLRLDLENETLKINGRVVTVIEREGFNL